MGMLIRTWSAKKSLWALPNGFGMNNSFNPLQCQLEHEFYYIGDLPLRDPLPREMRQCLDELRILEESETPSISVSHKHSSATACKGASFCLGKLGKRRQLGNSFDSCFTHLQQGYNICLRTWQDVRW
jgi:hypothetical protein